MRTLKDSWFMVRSDLRGSKSKIAATMAASVVMMLYLAGLTGMTIDDALAGNDRLVITDFLLLSFAPMLGFTYSRRTIKYWSEDSYTRMLNYLRSLPVPLTAILGKRKIQAALSFALNGILFFGLLYAVSGRMRDRLPVTDYLVFAFTWIGIGMVVAGVYIMIELSCSGRSYFWLTLLIIFLSLGIAFVISLGAGNLLFFTIDCSREWGVRSPLMWGTLLSGTLSVELFSRWTVKRLGRRDLV